MSRKAEAGAFYLTIQFVVGIEVTVPAINRQLRNRSGDMKETLRILDEARTEKQFSISLRAELLI